MSTVHASGRNAELLQRRQNALTELIQFGVNDLVATSRCRVIAETRPPELKQLGYTGRICSSVSKLHRLGARIFNSEVSEFTADAVF